MNMENKVVYIADLDQDIDDIIAVEYLLKYGALAYMICDPYPVTDEGKQRLNKLILKGAVRYPYIKEGVETVICGGGLTQVAEFLNRGGTLKALVMNGGFAGSNIVSPENELKKFKGKIFMKTYNFNIDIEATKKVLKMPPERIGRIILVGKNVCHSPRNTIADLWNSTFFKKIQEEYGITDSKRLHDVLACHEGLSLLNFIPDKNYCKFENLSVMNKNDTWGSAHSIFEEAGDLYRNCEVAVSFA
jgi:hypothetical protein